MRRAEWRRRADDPTGLLGWWWRSVGENRRLILAVLPFGVCALVGLAGGGWGWLVLAVANLVFVTSRERKGPDRLKPLLPDPPPAGQFRALVQYRRRGIVTGRDEVAFTVVDGWLVGEGVRSNFALRSSDVRKPRDPLAVLQMRLVLNDGGEVRVQEWIASPRAIEGIERWLRTASPEGDSVFPPARVHPQELTRWAARWMGVPFLFLLMPLARVYSPSEGVYVASLFGIVSLFVALTVWAMKHFLGLIRIEEEAREIEAVALVERTVPAIPERARRL